MLNGVDISFWQAGINIASIPADFVIVKATGGTRYVSPVFREQAEAVLAAGKLLGIYHYAQDDGAHPASEEASHFLNSFKSYKGRAIPMLDMEDRALNEGQGWAKEWLDQVAKETGSVPFFYTSASAVNGQDWSTIKGYPLWKASYLSRYACRGFEPNPVDIWPNGAWDKLTVYQYTSQGRLPGYDGNLDLNCFYGTKTDWKKYITGGDDVRIDKFCDRMRYWCEVANLGYDQSNRWDIRDGGECDCSSLVIHALREAGFDTGDASYTGNMSANLTARGWQRIRNDGHPKKGDILLNDANHVAVWLGDCLAQASIDENGNIAGGQGGDQTGRETFTRSYYNYPWDCYLRCVEDESPLNWPARTWPINMANAQKWHPIWNEDGSFVLESVSCGKRLDVIDGKNKSGTEVRVHRPNGAPAQSWKLEKKDVTPSGKDPYIPADVAPMRLIPVCAPKLRLQAKDRRLTIAKATHENVQNWAVLDCGDGNWVILNVENGEALDVVDGGK